MKYLVSTLIIFMTGCGGDIFQCSATSDCEPREICFAGQCKTNKTFEAENDKEEPNFSCGDSPKRGEVTINEILFAVPEGLDGDANADGIRDAHDDEFVEIVNRTDRVISLVGLRIENGTKAKFAFTSTCLKPKSSVVVFGGGSSPLSNAIISSRSFALSNAGGNIRLMHEENEIDSVQFSPIGPASIVRSPEISGEVFRQHQPALFSPGFCANGRSMESGCHTKSKLAD